MSKPVTAPDYVKYYLLVSLDKVGNFSLITTTNYSSIPTIMHPTENEAQQVATIERMRDPAKTYNVFEIEWPTVKERE
jgi:hypothetical protein